MMDKKADLYFSPLESYADFLRNTENVNRYGVYVWGFRFVNNKTGETKKFLPYYVGKHQKNIHQRIQEHVRAIRDETHKILRSELLNQPIFYRSTNPQDYAFINIEDKNRKKKDLTASEQAILTPHINAYVDNLYITYLSINHLGLAEDEIKQYAEWLERYVQDVIGMDRIVARSGRLYPADFCPNLHANEDTSCLLVNFPR